MVYDEPQDIMKKYDLNLKKLIDYVIKIKIPHICRTRKIIKIVLRNHRVRKKKQIYYCKLSNY